MAALLTWGGPAFAQLTDTTQTFPTVPGGHINRSVQEQIQAGTGPDHVGGTSAYFIKRDPARAIRRGRQIFQRKWTANQGLGPRVNFDGTGDIHANPDLGAGLSDSCGGCHGRPRGSAGFGGTHNARPDSVDAPHLFGLGLQEMLADEMTTDLRAIQTQALIDANAQQIPIVRNLVAKGVFFGYITAFPSGTVDYFGLEGVDEDLRVKPFTARGAISSIREFGVVAMKAEIGLETSDWVLCSATDPVVPIAMTSLAGFVFDPAVDTFNRPPVCSPVLDGDGDGFINEFDESLLDFLEFYLLNYFKPALGKQTTRTAQGETLLNTIGCTNCHVQDMTIDYDRRVADIDTVHDPVNGIFNRLFATATTLWMTVPDGQPDPKLLPIGNSFLVENIYTDFKRHDLGEAFHERNYDGTLHMEFMTEPLWGVGSTAPYGHDGRSMNLEEVILRHGGDALTERNSFVALTEDDQRKIIEFLQTLILFPPDDTASSLNPGNPGMPIQDPANHGSVDLSVLFIPSAEGPE